MKYQVLWFVRNQIAFLDFLMSPTESDIVQSTRDVYAMLKASPHSMVYCITNYSEDSSPLLGGETEMTSYSARSVTKQEWSLIIQEQTELPKPMLQSAEQYIKLRIKSFTSLGKVIEYLMSTDPSIDWGKADWHVFPDSILSLKGIQLQPSDLAHTLLRGTINLA